MGSSIMSAAVQPKPTAAAGVKKGRPGSAVSGNQTQINTSADAAPSVRHANGYESKRENPVLVDIEQTIGCPIQDCLMDYLDQQTVPASELGKAFKKKNSAITKQQILRLIKQVGGLDANKSIKICELVKLISDET